MFNWLIGWMLELCYCYLWDSVRFFFCPAAHMGNSRIAAAPCGRMSCSRSRWSSETPPFGEMDLSKSTTSTCLGLLVFMLVVNGLSRVSPVISYNWRWNLFTESDEPLCKDMHHEPNLHRIFYLDCSHICLLIWSYMRRWTRCLAWRFRTVFLPRPWGLCSPYTPSGKLQ